MSEDILIDKEMLERYIELPDEIARLVQENTRLQAEKADLLAALKALVQNINEQIVHNIDDTVYDMAVAAIARAKGEV